MCLMQHIHKVTVQIVEQLSRHRLIQNTVKHLRWNILQMKSEGVGGGGGAGGGAELGLFDKGTS